MNEEQIKELIYNIHRPRINKIVEKIDKCWCNNNKEGMLRYIKYIGIFVEFMEEERTCVKV